MNSFPLDEAIAIVRTTRGYEKVAQDLAQLASENRIRFDARLEDRAQAGLTGTITLGEEAASSSALSLAQTLVHEHFHLRKQNPLLKTVSFWRGVATRTPVMARYEKPAYRAAWDFLEMVARSQPLLANEARAEQSAIAQVFQSGFSEPLL